MLELANARQETYEDTGVKKYIDGGEAMLQAFRSLGVEYVFSSPGSEWAPYWEAVARQKAEGQGGPIYLDLWHETVAVAMATGFALATRRMQAVLLHAGPGLLQGTCAIHGALLAGTPMLVFSSEAITYGERPKVDPGSQWYRNLSIVGGPHTLVAPIVKWSNQVGSIEVLYEMVVRAGELAQRNGPGPVYLNVPVEVLLEPWTPPVHRRKTPPPSIKISPQEDIAAMVDMLLEAAHPVVVTETAGGDPEAFRALTELCDLLAIPVVEPQSAVCANFPRTHPMHQGGGLEPFLSDETDLVVLVSCRAPWYPPSAKPAKARTVVIDEVPQRPHIVYQVLHADRYLEGRVAVTLRGAVKLVRERGVNTEQVAARRAKFTAAHEKLTAQMRATEAKAQAAEQVIDPALLAKFLREATAPDAVFVDETITHSRVLQQHLQIEEPGRYYYVQGGLGQGIGQALGVKLGVGKRMVVLAIGDGTFLYNPVIASLAAARDNNLPILIVVFNNKKYLSMKLNHLRFYPDGVAVGTNDFHGVNLETQPELSAFAEPFGMYGRMVSKPSELPGAFESAVAVVKAGRTAILNVMVSR